MIATKPKKLNKTKLFNDLMRAAIRNGFKKVQVSEALMGVVLKV